jgi:hypothetical protein
MQPFTLTYILGNPNRTGQRLIYLRYRSAHVKTITIPAFVRIKENQFNADNVKLPIKKHAKAKEWKIR